MMAGRGGLVKRGSDRASSRVVASPRLGRSFGLLAWIALRAEYATPSLDTHVGLTRIERKGEHQIAKALHDMFREMKQWDATGGGLRVVTDADLQKRHERWIELRDRSDQDRAEQTTDADAEARETPDDGPDDAEDKAA